MYYNAQLQEETKVDNSNTSINLRAISLSGREIEGVVCQFSILSPGIQAKHLNLRVSYTTRCSYRHWDLSDMRALRMAEKLRTTGVDLSRVKKVFQATPEWMRSCYPVLDSIESEVESELGAPTDDEVWWAVCNAAYQSKVEVGDPKYGTNKKLRVEARA